MAKSLLRVDSFPAESAVLAIVPAACGGGAGAAAADERAAAPGARDQGTVRTFATVASIAAEAPAAPDGRKTALCTYLVGL